VVAACQPDGVELDAFASAAGALFELETATPDVPGRVRPATGRLNTRSRADACSVGVLGGGSTGEQVTERALLGLLARPVEKERADADRMIADWLGALAEQGLIGHDRRPDADEFTAALYGYLARTPALLIGVSLAEAVGERRSQNMPGTTIQYPNWRVPLCGSTGSPIPRGRPPGPPRPARRRSRRPQQPRVTRFVFDGA
jgi:hypothetical protein